MPSLRKRTTTRRKQKNNRKQKKSRKQNKSFNKNIMHGGFSSADFGHAIIICTFFGLDKFYTVNKSIANPTSSDMNVYEFNNANFRYNSGSRLNKNKYFKNTKTASAGAMIGNYDIYININRDEYIKMDKANWTGTFTSMMEDLLKTSSTNATTIVKTAVDSGVMDPDSLAIVSEARTSLNNSLQEIGDENRGSGILQTGISMDDLTQMLANANAHLNMLYQQINTKENQTKIVNFLDNIGNIIYKANKPTGKEIKQKSVFGQKCAH